MNSSVFSIFFTHLNNVGSTFINQTGKLSEFNSLSASCVLIGFNYSEYYESALIEYFSSINWKMVGLSSRPLCFQRSRVRFRVRNVENFNEQLIILFVDLFDVFEICFAVLCRLSLWNEYIHMFMLIMRYIYMRGEGFMGDAAGFIFSRYVGDYYPPRLLLETYWSGKRKKWNDKNKSEKMRQWKMETRTQRAREREKGWKKM